MARSNAASQAGYIRVLVGYIRMGQIWAAIQNYEDTKMVQNVGG